MKYLLVALALSFSLSSFAEVKVAVVNIQKVITSIKEGKAVMKTLENSVKSKQKVMKKERV